MNGSGMLICLYYRSALFFRWMTKGRWHRDGYFENSCVLGWVYTNKSKCCALGWVCLFVWWCL